MAQRALSTEPDAADRAEAAWVRAFAAGRRLRMPAPGAPSSSDEARQRGWVDAQAAWHRWHQPAVAKRFSAAELPYFAILDRARVEQLSSRSLPGMRSNLADCARIAPLEPAQQMIYQCARRLAAGQHDQARFLLDQAREFQRPGGIGSSFRAVAKALGWRDAKADMAAQRRADVEELLQDLLELQAWSDDVLVDASEFASRVQPLVARCAHLLAPPVAAEPGGDAAEDGEDPDLAPELSAEDPESELEQEGLAEADSLVARAYPGYAVFTHRHDETAPAARWLQPSDMSRLDSLKRIDRRRARQLAHRLMRRLQVARLRRWDYDQESGLVDSRRLARLLQPDSDPRVFRRESDTPVPEAAVSLLVDLSGSMRGERLMSAAVALDLAVHVLETCGVKSEVLGFTTRFGEDNLIERRWRLQGASESPGRLNAVRHVVFKPVSRPWRQCRRSLGLLLREGFGAENIDGEALHWAATRLLQLNVERRILVVLSDGAPFDQATAQANGREFLCDHLRAVIEKLEDCPIHLVALGTGSDVSRFYRQAVTLTGPDAVAETLFDKLGDLLTCPVSAGDRR